MEHNGSGLGDGLEFETRQPEQMMNRITKNENLYK